MVIATTTVDVDDYDDENDDNDEDDDDDDADDDDDCDDDEASLSSACYVSFDHLKCSSPLYA